VQLVVARIGRAHGIKGEVTVEVRTDEPELRLAPGAVLFTDPAPTGPLTIETGRVHSGKLLLRMPPALHSELARAAEREGSSLNAYITETLSNALRGEEPVVDVDWLQLVRAREG